MAEKAPQTRIFVKEVGGETVRREVTSPQAEVSALFDGFTEESSSPAKPNSSKSTPASGSSSS